jgi:hypothetical protein
MNRSDVFFVPSFFSSNFQIFKKIIFLLLFFSLLKIQASNQVFVSPTPLETGDVVSIFFEYSTHSSDGETLINLSYDLPGYKITNPGEIELNFNGSFCTDCSGSVNVNNDSRRVDVSISAPQGRTISGSGPIVQLDGVVIELDEIDYRKAIPETLSLEVYPNPASDFIFLKGQPDFTQARLVNLQGKAVRKMNLLNDLQKISVRDLAKGNYVLQVITSQGQVLNKRISVI